MQQLKVVKNETSNESYYDFNEEAKCKTSQINNNRIECFVKRDAFITLNDHKPGFTNKPTNRSQT